MWFFLIAEVLVMRSFEECFYLGLIFFQKIEGFFNNACKFAPEVWQSGRMRRS